MEGRHFRQCRVVAEVPCPSTSVKAICLIVGFEMYCLTQMSRGQREQTVRRQLVKCIVNGGTGQCERWHEGGFPTVHEVQELAGVTKSREHAAQALNLVIVLLAGLGKCARSLLCT